MNKAMQSNPSNLFLVTFYKGLALIMAVAFVVSPLSQIGLSIAFAAGNEVVNGSLNAHTIATAPDGWQPGGFDGDGPIENKATFTYVQGRSATSSTDTTDKAVQVALSAAVTGGGDAKWVQSNPLSVPQGAFYTFTDWYKSDVTSYLLAEFVVGSNAPRYFALATLNPTGTNIASAPWVQATADFSIPAASSAVTLRVFHVVKNVGTLVTDDYSIEQDTVTKGGFSPAIVSLTFDDGWTSHYDNVLPRLQNTGIPATFYVMSTSTVAASHDLIAIQSAQVGGTVASTSANGTTWSPIYRDPSTNVYRFSDRYEGAESSVTLTYAPQGGGATTTVTLATLGATASGVPQKSGFVFTLPAITPGSPLSISHTALSGSLQVTPGSGALINYGSGYMSSLQLKDILAANVGSDHNEIGNHTEDHCSLSRMLAGDPIVCAFSPAFGATAGSEVSNAKSVLESMLSTTINTLAYPFGEYNSGVKSVVATGNAAARTVDIGYNRTNSDKLALKSQTIDSDTTLSTVQGWVETAIANNLWLILTFHQVDNPALTSSNGETGGITIQAFNAIMDYLQGQKANVNFKTVRDALPFLTGLAPADQTAPVIATHADVSAQATSTSGMSVTYTNPSFTDETAPATGTATCSPISGSNFSVGTTTVTCNASDTAGNNATPKTFSVIVAAPVATSTTPTPDTQAPVIAPHSNVVAVATSSTGIVVTYTPPSTSDNVDQAGLAVCGPLSGTNFSIGTSTVSCNASDAAGNKAATTTFSVIVTSGSSTTPSTAACSDGIDNDGDGLIDAKDPGCYTTFNANDTGSYRASDNDETNVLEAVTPTTAGGGGGGGNGPISGTVLSFPGTTGGSVLGTSTVSTTTSGICVPLLTKTLKFNSKKNSISEVKKFQRFLNKKQNSNLPETGFFGKLTRAAHRLFQSNNASTILAPLGLVSPTDFVGVNTRAVINAQNCLMK